MPPPFRRVTLEQFATLLENFNFQRRITEVHIHHTSSPTHAQWRGHESVVAMYRHHTQVRGFSDIAQHITIAPDGGIFLGRNWNRSPASAVGFNGNSQRGPFMFEMVGDFNNGRDSFQDPQRNAALQVIALVQKRFGLPVDAFRFHRQMSDTDCPGESLRRPDVLAALMALRSSRAIERDDTVIDLGNSDELPFSPEHFIDTKPASNLPALVEPAPLTEELRALVRELEQLSGAVARGIENDEDPHTTELFTMDKTQSTRNAELSTSELERLRPHIINLNQGRFSDNGEFTTSRADVDTLFEESLPHYVAGRLHHSTPSERKVRLLFWAHGGLAPESAALRYAHDNLSWWLANGIYPIFFVWETGFFETIGQLLRDAHSRVAPARDLFDITTDPLLEVVARAVGGVRIWGGMKLSAERASAARAADHAGPGGARYVAQKLATFCQKHDTQLPIDLYAAGHSAGAVFHSHFLPAAKQEGIADFRELFLLAPALRCDEFKVRLLPYLGAGNGVTQTTIFTMNRLRERDDHCAHLYQKSLLYLIYYALEPETKTPLLGLEDSLRADSQLKAFFGLGGASSSAGTVIFSKTDESSGRSATQSLSHGGFDEDPATLESIARRVRGVEDASPLPLPFPRPRTSGLTDTWNEHVDLPQELASMRATLTPQPLTTPVPQERSERESTRRAVCVGIDAYSRQPLSGCVADARSWDTTLRSLGFSTTLLLNNQATRSNILQSLRTLIQNSQPGDVLAFHYSGHGTTVPDISGDDTDDDTPLQDEALCPVDFQTGALLGDDDLGEELKRLPEGVSLTLFMDCCHSGSISRFAAIQAAQLRAVSNDLPRQLTLTSEELAAHQKFRASRGEVRSFRGGGPLSRGPATQKEVLLAACRSNELAWESNGQGEFTVRATTLLRTLGSAGTASLSNAAFHSQVVAAFGSVPRQQPQLDCAPSARERGLLQPLVGNGVKSHAVVSPLSEDRVLLETLEQLLRVLRQRIS